MRAGMISENNHFLEIGFLSGELFSDSNGKIMKKKKSGPAPNYVVDVESQQKGGKVGLRMMGLEAVGEHNTAEDCWVAIDGNVYDLTDFLSLHPGGSQVLLDVAGQDASKKFLEAGHSMKARKMMTKHLIGHILGRSYEQKNDVPLNKNCIGDFNKPYEIGQSYITFQNSSLYAMCVSATLLLWMQVIFYRGGDWKESYNLHLFYGCIAPSIGPVISILVASLLVSYCLNICCLSDSSNTARAIEGQLGNTTPLRFRSCFSLCCDWHTHFSSMIIVLYLIADYVILSIKYGHTCRAMRVSILITCTLELLWRTLRGNVTLPRTNIVFKVLLACFPVICLVGASVLDLYSVSLYISRAYENHSEDGEFEKNMTSYKLFAINIFCSALIRFVFARSCRPPPNKKFDYNMTFSRLFLASAYAFLLLFFVASAQAQIGSISDVSFVSFGYENARFLVFFMCALIFPMFYQTYVKLSSTSTSYFASQSYCIWLCFFLWLCAPSVGIARWYSFILFMVAMKVLSYEAEVELELHGADASNWVYQAKQVENSVRYAIAQNLQAYVALPVTNIISFIAPKSQASRLSAYVT